MEIPTRSVNLAINFTSIAIVFGELCDHRESSTVTPSLSSSSGMKITMATLRQPFAAGWDPAAMKRGSKLAMIEGEWMVNFSPWPTLNPHGSPVLSSQLGDTKES